MIELASRKTLVPACLTSPVASSRVTVASSTFSGLKLLSMLLLSTWRNSRHGQSVSRDIPPINLKLRHDLPYGYRQACDLNFWHMPHQRAGPVRVRSSSGEHKDLPAGNAISAIRIVLNTQGNIGVYNALIHKAIKKIYKVAQIFTPGSYSRQNRPHMMYKQSPPG